MLVNKGGYAMAKNPRILVFGAGVIGSIHALRFAQAGMDVALYARGRRVDDRYAERGDDDIYDFILATVRLDQMESALLALKSNKSKGNARILEEAGISICEAKIFGKLPTWAVAAIFRALLSVEAARDVLIGDHAQALREEVRELDRAFQERKFS
jgi:choline dehydrogenase-like flavoprotein